MLLATAIVLWCFVLPVVSLPTVSAIGAKFFDSDGNQFFIKGIVQSFYLPLRGQKIFTFTDRHMLQELSTRCP